MDLSKLSTQDLIALQKGDLSAVSTDGLKFMQGASQPAPQAPKEQSWGDVASSAVSNVIPSTGKMIGGVVDAAMQPLDTASNVLRLGVGGAMKVLPQEAQDWIVKNSNDPEKVKQTLDMAGATGDFYKQRYGSVEGFKQALSTDPAGIAADAATLLSGGAGIASKAGLVKTASALRTGASAVDPLANTLRAGKGALNLAGQGSSKLLGMTTGAGSEAINQAYKAGDAGGDTARAFADNMRGNVPMNDVLDAVDANLAKMGAEKAAAYKADMAQIGKNAKPLPFAPIEQSVVDAMGVKSYKGVSTSKSTADIQAKISDVVQEWKALDPAEYHTAEGFDALKQSIGDLRDSTQFGSPERRVADSVYHAVKNEIVKAEPLYAKAMADYSKASELAKEIRSSLSANPKASIDTQMRKLQSLMRNNVSTNYGNRIDLVKAMEQQGGNQILPSIAGQALNTWTPRGLQSATTIPTILSGAAVGGMGTGAALIPMASPRLAGEATFKAGQVAGALRKGKEFAGGLTSGAVDELAKQLKISPAKLKADPRLLANILYQMNQPKEQTDQ